MIILPVFSKQVKAKASPVSGMTLHRAGLVYEFSPKCMTKAGFLRKSILRRYREPVTREQVLDLMKNGVTVYVEPQKGVA